MMLDEATTVHVVKGAIYTNGVESSTPSDLERVILSSLSRLVSAECVPHFTGGELRLFDFDHHLRTLKNFSRGGDDGGAGRPVIGVAQADFQAGALLYQDFVTTRSEFPDAGGRQTDPELIVFNFFWDSNNHVFLQVLQLNLHHYKPKVIRLALPPAAVVLTHRARSATSRHRAMAVAAVVSISPTRAPSRAARARIKAGSLPASTRAI